MSERRHKKLVLYIVLAVMIISTFVLVKNKSDNVTEQTIETENTTNEENYEEGSKVYIDLKDYDKPVKQEN